jgi:tetratricopeptide (TPR) repeat protein
MLEGLKDNEESVDSNGNVTPYSLNRYISKKINSLPVEKRPRQKPLMKSETSGEIILASYPKSKLLSPTASVLSSPPVKSTEAAVHKGILRSKSKILVAALATVVAITLTLALFNHHNYSSTTTTSAPLVGRTSTTSASNDTALSLDTREKGLGLQVSGNYTGAIAYYDKAVELDPKDTLNDKCVALNDLRNYTGAIEYYDKALAIDPKYVYALNNKGLALDNLGNHTGAILYYDKALAIDPKDTYALTNKASLLDILGITPGNAAKFLQYRNSIYGIKIEYPSDWRVLGGSNSSIVASFYPQYSTYRSYVTVQIENLTTNYTPNQYLNSLMLGDAADYKAFPDIRFNQNTTNNIVLASHAGYLLNGTYRDPISDALQRFTNIGTIIGNKVYSIIYYSPAYTYPVYSTIYHQMIRSFEVIPQKN